MTAKSLSGTLCSQLGALTSLSSLDLSFNSLSGTAPSQLGQLTLITSLSLASNKLTGSVPSQLGNNVLLSALSLYSNSLSASLPTQLGALILLTALDIRHGTGPESVWGGRCAALRAGCSDFLTPHIHSAPLLCLCPTQLQLLIRRCAGADGGAQCPHDLISCASCQIASGNCGNSF